VPDEKDKPVLDEQTFGRLLEAAYVLQEHNRALHKLERNLEVHSEHLATQEVAQEVAQKVVEEKHSLSILPSAELPTPEVPLESARLAEDFLPEPSPVTIIPTTLAPAALAGSAPAQAAAQADYTLTLAQIVETQHQIQARHLELESAMSLVAQRVTEIAQAGGAAIGFVDGKKVRYRGVAGLMALPVGTEVPYEKALCVASLKTGQVIRCADVSVEFLLDPDECRRRGIQALIAVPIFHEGGIAGGLELYYATTQAFTEQDVNTCQLMAGLITEALARDEELGWKKSLASERAVMLEALEKLKPNLAALVDKPAAKGSASRSSGSRRGTAAAVSSAPIFVCRKCGHKLVGEEQFCGKCGTRRGDRANDHLNDRPGEYEAPSMQGKVSSLWHMQEAPKKSATASSSKGDPGHFDPLLASDPARPEKPLADSIEEEMPELFAAPELRVGKMSDPEEFQDALPTVPMEVPAQPEIIAPKIVARENAAREIVAPGIVVPEIVVPISSAVEEDAIPGAASQQLAQEDEENESPAPTALVKPVPVANWSSAMSAREFLEQLAGSGRPGALARFWKARRGDIYLAIAVILVAGVIRWGIWSNHSVSATGSPATTSAAHRKPAPDADLSLWDRMLISLGLAEAPPAPEYHGNPDAQVWVDLHTALYYCAGADLYGKTPKGRFTSQREAQLDQFEPAYRKACD
jgi:putative methionine-R-sulfoxide reductase with GAF domain